MKDRSSKGNAYKFTKVELAYLYDALEIVQVSNKLERAVGKIENKIPDGIIKQLRFKISRILG